MLFYESGGKKKIKWYQSFYFWVWPIFFYYRLKNGPTNLKSFP